MCRPVATDENRQCVRCHAEERVLPEHPGGQEKVIPMFHVYGASIGRVPKTILVCGSCRARLGVSGKRA